MLLQNKTVAIMGAGPVGLTMARLLHQQDVDVRVYERDSDPNARIWGGTLDLHPDSGIPAMQKAGLLDGYYALAKPMGRVVFDKQGHKLFSVDPDHKSPEINRNNLRKLLLESLTENTVVWDRKCTALEPKQVRWLLHFEDQQSETADIVIVANGGMSDIRAYVTDTKVESTGSFIIMGEVQQPSTNCAEFFRLCNDQILMATSRGVTFTANPDNNGALTYGLSFRQHTGIDLQLSDSSRIAGFLTKMLSDWNAVFHRLIHATSFFVALPSRLFPVDQPWKQHRPLPITLIGDAAHLMPPFAGKGVNTGMMDALRLSENLTGGRFDTIEAAIADYEEYMKTYASEAQQETAGNEIAMHQPDYSFRRRFIDETLHGKE